MLHYQGKKLSFVDAGPQKIQMLIASKGENFALFWNSLGDVFSITKGITLSKKQRKLFRLTQLRNRPRKFRLPHDAKPTKNQGDRSGTIQMTPKGKRRRVQVVEFPMEQRAHTLFEDGSIKPRGKDVLH